MDLGRGIARFMPMHTTKCVVLPLIFPLKPYQIQLPAGTADLTLHPLRKATTLWVRNLGAFLDQLTERQHEIAFRVRRDFSIDRAALDRVQAMFLSSVAERSL